MKPESFYEEVRAGEHSITDCILSDIFRVLFCQFWSTILQCGAWLQVDTTGECSQWCPCFNWGVIGCSILHRRSVQYKIRFLVLYTCAVFASSGYMRCLVWSHIGIKLCASSLQNLAVQLTG